MVSGASDSHGGGDIHSLQNFLRALSDGYTVDTPLHDAFRGLCAGIAVETARLEERTVAVPQ